MPARSKRLCNRPGCRDTTYKRFCDKHNNDGDKQRANANSRGYNYRWGKFRKTYINANPLCVFCLDNGTVTTATDVDHIKPLADCPELKYNVENLRSLCHACHSRRTATDQPGARK